MNKRLVRFFWSVLLAVGLCAVSRSSIALETEWVDLDFSQVRLISANSTVGDSAVLRLGLQIKMNPGFKTYWRSPGDAGIPPRFDWAGSDNIAQATVRWPAPERFVLGGFNTFGYANEIVLPIEIELASPGRAVDARLELVYGVCRDICVLGEAKFDLTVPVGISEQTPHGDLIDWFDRLVPTTATGAVDIESARVVRIEDRDVVEIVAVAIDGPGFDQLDILVEGMEDIALPAPQVDVDPNRRRAKVSYRLPASPSSSIRAPRRVTLTLLDGEYAFEKLIVLSTNN